MLLTVDPGSNLGWTLGPVSADAPPAQVAHGTFKLRDTTDLGAFLVSADEPLRDLFGRGVTAWAIEIPNTRYIKSAAAAAKLMGIYSHCLYWASLCALEKPTGFAPNEIKLALTGNGGADKDMMIAAARALGHMVLTDHEADAIAIRRAYLFGVPETKTEREKRAAAERRAARAAKKGPKLL